MTNKEKAIELERKYEELYDREDCCVVACQKMAEWKEETMIEKACKWLEENMSVVNVNAVNYGDISFAASKIIGGKENFLEQFRKAMEEQLC